MADRVVGDLKMPCKATPIKRILIASFQVKSNPGKKEEMQDKPWRKTGVLHMGCDECLIKNDM